MYKTVLTGMFFLAACGTVDARVLKWVDQAGQVHYSETAPTEQKTQELSSQPSPPPMNGTSGSQSDRIIQEMETAERARKADREAQEKALAERRASERKARCAVAQHNLDALRRQVPVYTQGGGGEKTYMDDETRTAETGKMEQLAAENCESR